MRLASGRCSASARQLRWVLRDVRNGSHLLGHAQEVWCQSISVEGVSLKCFEPGVRNALGLVAEAEAVGVGQGSKS